MSEGRPNRSTTSLSSRDVGLDGEDLEAVAPPVLSSLHKRQLRGFYMARQLHLTAEFERTVLSIGLHPLFRACLPQEEQQTTDATVPAPLEQTELLLRQRLLLSDPVLSSPLDLTKKNEEETEEEAEAAAAAVKERRQLRAHQRSRVLARKIIGFCPLTPSAITTTTSTSPPPHLFYVVPPHATSDGHFTTEGFGGGAHGSKDVFVRFLKDSLMNDESLNLYFGRYGQVSSQLCRSVRLLDGGFSPQVVDLLSTSFDVHPSLLLLQDFIIHVDSEGNALRALHRAYAKELLFIALSSEELNQYGSVDVDRMMEEFLPHRLPPAPLPMQKLTEPLLTDATRLYRKRRRRRRRRGFHVQEDGNSSSSSSSSGSTDSGSSSSSSPSSTSDDEDAEGGEFVPDVIIDGMPYWMTADQIKILVQESGGTVRSLKLAMEDRSGVFMGAVLVGMATLMEAIQLSETLHGHLYDDTHPLVCGVLTPTLDIVTLRTGEMLQPNTESATLNHLTANERLWV